jgi:hypothetical protein
VLSSAAGVNPGSSRTRFRDRPETVRLHRGIGVHLHPGILFAFPGTAFGIIPESRSRFAGFPTELSPGMEGFFTARFSPLWTTALIESVADWVLKEIPRVTTEGKLERPLDLAQREGGLSE